jgi:hypothetical protein
MFLLGEIDIGDLLARQHIGVAGVDDEDDDWTSDLTMISRCLSAMAIPLEA